MKLMERVFLVGSGQLGLSAPGDCHTYLVDGGSELALVDAGLGPEPEQLIDNIVACGFDVKNVTKLFVTHCHADHAGGVKGLKRQIDCEIVCTEAEAAYLSGGSESELGLDRAKRSGIYPADYRFPHVVPDRIVGHGDIVQVGDLSAHVLVVPGHSRAPACLLVDINGCRVLFSSDVVFWGGTIGLGNWAGSSLAEYRDNIGRLGGLAVDALLPGHFLWSMSGGQEHLDTAIANMGEAWVPPAWQHYHPHR